MSLTTVSCSAAHTLKGKQLCWLYLECQQSLFLHRLILVDAETWGHICLSDPSDLQWNDTEQLFAKYPVSPPKPQTLWRLLPSCYSRQRITGTLRTSETSQYKQFSNVAKTPQLSEDWRNIAKHINLAYVRKTLGVVSFLRNDDASDWPCSHQTSLFRHVFRLSSYLLPLNFALEIFHWLNCAKCSFSQSFRIFKMISTTVVLCTWASSANHNHGIFRTTTAIWRHDQPCILLFSVSFFPSVIGPCLKQCLVSIVTVSPYITYFPPSLGNWNQQRVKKD